MPDTPQRPKYDTGLNEHAMSLINYYVGVLPVDATEYEALDHQVRQVLLKHHAHYQAVCKERLYLPRDEMGRGLKCLSHQSELMLLQLHNTLTDGASISTRRAAILKVEQESKTHMALIREFLQAQYENRRDFDKSVSSRGSAEHSV